jgi:hypothetical protein
MSAQARPMDTLITPVQCKSIWRQFKAETQYAVAQAISMQVHIFVPLCHVHFVESMLMIFVFAT